MKTQKLLEGGEKMKRPLNVYSEIFHNGRIDTLDLSSLQTRNIEFKNKTSEGYIYWSC